MKKITSFVLTAILLGTVTASDFKPFSNFNISGELEFLGVAGKNITDANSDVNDDFRNLNSRITLNGDFDLADNLHGFITLIYGGYVYNENPATNEGYFGNQPAGSITTLEGNLNIAQAYIVYDDFLGVFRLKIGKQFYGEEDSAIIYFGKDHTDNLIFSALDAIRADYNEELFGILNEGHLIYAKRNDASLTTDNDLSDLGWHNWIHFSGKVNLAIYAYNYRGGVPDTVRDSWNLWTFGIRAKGLVNNFEYDVESMSHAGHRRDYPNEKKLSLVGYGFIAKAGYNFNTDIGNVKPRGMFAYGSGANNYKYRRDSSKDKFFYGSDAGNFRPGEIFGNSGGQVYQPNLPKNYFMLARFFPSGVIPGYLTNLSVWNLGFDYFPDFLKQFSFHADGYRFFVNSSDTDGGYTALTGVPPTYGNHHIGSEVDLVIKYKPSKTVYMKLVAARFWPGSYLKRFYIPNYSDPPTTNNDPITKLSVYMSFKFGKEGSKAEYERPAIFKSKPKSDKPDNIEPKKEVTKPDIKKPVVENKDLSKSKKQFEEKEGVILTEDIE